jgi:hypothetical protein
MAIWYNLWPFGIVCGHLVYFPILVCLDQAKSGNPSPERKIVGSSAARVLGFRCLYLMLLLVT